MNFKYVLKTLAVLTIILPTLFACSKNSDTDSGEDGDIQLVMWHTFSDVETKVFEDDLIKKFEEENDGIKVKSTRMPAGDEFNQQLVQAISGGSSPDLARMDIVEVPKYAKLGALEELDDYEGFNEIKDEMFEAPMSTNLYNGKYYGLPLDTNTKIAIYNKKLLEKSGLSTPPKTIDELLQAAEKIKGKEMFGIAISGIEVWNTMPYFLSLGGKYTNQEYTQASGYLNSDSSIKALETIVQWNKDGLVGKSLVGGLGSWEGFKGDNYMMIDDGPWFAAANSDVSENIEYSLLPSGSAGSISTIGGEDTVVFKSSKNKDAAFKFAKYLASDEAQTILGEKLKMMPVNKTTGEKDFVKNDEMLNIYMEQLKTAQARIPSPEWSEINKVITKAFEKALKTNTSAKEVLDEAAVQVDALLGK